MVNHAGKFTRYAILGLNLAVFVALNLGIDYGPPSLEPAIIALVAQRGAFNLLLGQFCHLSAIHILLNLVTFASFAPLAQVRLNARSFVLVYLAAGLVGSLAHYLISPLPAIGASGAVSGIIAFMGTYFRQRRFTFLLLFILPLRVSGAMLVGIFVGLNLIGWITAYGGISFVSHLGGCAVGITAAFYYQHRDRQYRM